MAVKAINDTAGPNGIVLTLFVFGAYPRLSSTTAPSVTRRATAIKAAMKDLQKVRAQRQITETLRMRNGPDIQKPKLTDLVLVWREAHGSGATATTAGWQGPYRVQTVDNETITGYFGNGTTAAFRSTSVRVCKTTTSDADTAVAVKRGRGRPEIIEGRNSSIWLTAPAPTPSYDASRRAEIFGLLEKDVLEPFPRTEIPPRARLFNGRFVDEVKHAGTAQAGEKSRSVVQAHSDHDKATVLTESPTIQRMSGRFPLSVAAYVQATTYLRRDFYVNPNAAVREILELAVNAVLRIKKPPYGVPEDGNHWFATYTKHHIEEVGMSQSKYDACVMTLKKDAPGLVGLQTDDTLILATLHLCDLGTNPSIDPDGFRV